MRLAITGAAGFVGRHLVAEALQRGHDVLALVRPSHPEPSCRGARVNLGEDTADLAALFSGLDAVLHAAGRVSSGPASAFARDNADATGEVARAALAAGIRMVHVSTTAVYGPRAAGRGPVREDAPLGYRVDARDRYATSKIDAELRLRVFDGLDVAVIRPGLILGPGGRSTARLRALARGGVAPLIGRGDNRLPITHVASVVDAILRAAEVPEARGQAFQIAGDWPLTQRGLYLALAAGQRPPRFVPLPYPAALAAGLVAQIASAGHPLLWSRSAAALLGLDADFPADRARQVLGWAPALSMEEALAAAD